MLVIRANRCQGKTPREALNEVETALAGKGYVVELVPDVIFRNGSTVEVLPPAFAARAERADPRPGGSRLRAGTCADQNGPPSSP